jgi:hypothetical protein
MSKREATFGMFHIILGICVVIFAAVLGIVQLIQNDDDALPEPVNIIELTEEMCSSAGGVWNSCGSACRGEEMDTCVQVCVEMCECTSNETCPLGFACIQMIDGIGICAR